MDFFERSTRISALFGAAESYYFLGYSVIPVYGDCDPARAKVAAVNWQPFQHRRATPAHFKHWFQEQAFGGLAILTGAISGLVVLDFDDPQTAADFASQYPHLTQTRTVLSAGRNLPHYYYELPPSISLSSMSAKGVDLQANGRYVVAPPTRLGNQTYNIVRGGQPHSLTPAQARLLQSFVETQRSAGSASGQSAVDSTSEKAVFALPEKRLSITLSSATQSDQAAENDTPAADRMPLSPDEAQTLYRYHAPRIGRNNALFKVALRLRDTGWLLDDTLACLVELHARQPATNSHPPETIKQRRIEAERTIRSAFSRPPGRPPSRSEDADAPEPPGLPNSVREAFLQQKQGYVVRVLDALLLAGAEPGQLLTEKIITEALDGLVGRYSILKALKATYHDKSPVFRDYDGDIAAYQNTRSTKTPSPGTPTPADAASATAEDTNNNCLLFRATKPDKKRRGRPPTYYIMPDIETMCAQLDVKFTASDPLKTADLQSIKKYRQGLEREFIKRAPGLYPRRWLAKRLGISVRTSQRYRQDLPLKQREMFFKRLITWENVDSIPETDEPEGIFLQDETGKRYPPVCQLAAKLLAEGRTVFLMHQDVNYYWHPDTPPSPLAMMGIHPKQHQATKHLLDEFETADSDSKAGTWMKKPLNPPENTPKTVSETANTANNASEPVTKPDTTSHDKPETAAADASAATEAPLQPRPKPFKPKSNRYYRRELPESNDEYYAMKLYRKTRDICKARSNGDDIPPHYLSKASARRLTDQYGYQLVKKLIQVLTWRDGIENPAGFAVVWLRSTSKSLSQG
jgi:hypothetical protein